MPYISGFDRKQFMLCSWDMFVEEESIARLIDAFVNSLDIEKYGVKTMSVEGRPSYDPKSLYKLYIYGSRKGIRSSRKLAESCRVNLEVKWMLGGVEPDFRTISGRTTLTASRKSSTSLTAGSPELWNGDFPPLMEAKFRRTIQKTITSQRINWMTGFGG